MISARAVCLALCVLAVGSALALFGSVRADVQFVGNGAGIVARRSYNVSLTWDVFSQLSFRPPVQKLVAIKYDDKHRILWWSTASYMAYCPMNANWFCTGFYNISLPFTDALDFDIDQRDGSAYFITSASKRLYRALSPVKSSWEGANTTDVFEWIGNATNVDAAKYGIAIHTERTTGKTWLYTLSMSDNLLDTPLKMYRVDISAFPSTISSITSPSELLFSYSAGHKMYGIRMNFDKSTGILYFHDTVLVITAALPALYMMPTEPLPDNMLPTTFQSLPSSQQADTNYPNLWLVYCLQPAPHWSIQVTAGYTVSLLFWWNVHYSFSGPSSLPGFGTLGFKRVLEPGTPKLITNEVESLQVATAFDDKLILTTALIGHSSDARKQQVGIISSRSGYYLANQKAQFSNFLNPSVRFFLNTTVINLDLDQVSPKVQSVAVDNDRGVLYWSNSIHEIWAQSIDDRKTTLVFRDDSNSFSRLTIDYRYNHLFAVVDGADEIAVFLRDNGPTFSEYIPLTASPFANLVSIAVYHRQAMMFVLTKYTIFRGAVPMNMNLPIPDYEFCEDEPNCGHFTPVATAPDGLTFRDIAVDQTKGLLWIVTSDGVVRLFKSIACSHFDCEIAPVVLHVDDAIPFNKAVLRLAIEEQQLPQYTAMVSSLSNERIDGRKIALNPDEMMVITEDGQIHTIVHFANTSTVNNGERAVYLSTFLSPQNITNYDTNYAAAFGETTTLIYPNLNRASLLDCTGECKLFCPPGFTASASGSSCEQCPINTYKNSSGSFECTACRTYLWPLSFEDPGNITCSDHFGSEVALVLSFLGFVVFFLLLCLIILVVIIILVALAILGQSRKKKNLDEPVHTIMPPINEQFQGIQGKASIRVDTTRYDVSIDEFKIVQKIGSGTYSNVYKAEFRNDIVALKKLNLASVTDEASSNNPHAGISDEVRALTTEFEHEASLLATLRHKNIVSFVAAVTIYPNYAIATEFMEFGSLFDMLKRVKSNQQKLEWKTKLQIACDVSRGMEYLHRNNVIHRDLKSPNILLDNKFSAKVGDFGLSRMKEKAASVMTANVGSPLWLAPEVTLGQLYDNKCDVFSFGIVMWELLTNEQPYFDFKGPKIQIHMKVATDPTFRPTIPNLDGRRISEAYLQLMSKCWAQNSTERPAFSETTKELSALAN